MASIAFCCWHKIEPFIVVKKIIINNQHAFCSLTNHQELPEGHLRKVLGENLGGKSWKKILGENLERKSWGKILKENLGGKCRKKILWEILERKSWGEILKENLGGKSWKKILGGNPPTWKGSYIKVARSISSCYINREFISQLMQDLFAEQLISNFNPLTWESLAPKRCHLNCGPRIVVLKLR